MDEMVEDARIIFGRNAKWYSSSPDHADQEVLSGLVCMANPDSQAVVLDVATGTGNTWMTFSPFVRQVIGMDFTPEMLSQAVDAMRRKSVGNMDLCLADVMAIPFPDSTFDLVLSRRAPHHFRDIKGALKEMSRVLRPGGVLAIDDRTVPEDDGVDRTMNLLDALHDRSHVREYRPSEWKGLVSEAGLEPMEMRTYTRNLPLTRLTGTANEDDAKEIVKMVGTFNEEMKGKFGHRTVSGEVHINHWFLMFTAVKSIKPTY